RLRQGAGRAGRPPPFVARPAGDGPRGPEEDVRAARLPAPDAAGDDDRAGASVPGAAAPDALLRRRGRGPGDRAGALRAPEDPGVAPALPPRARDGGLHRARGADPREP